MKKDSLETRQKDYITAFSTDKKFIKTLSISDEEALRTDVHQKSSQVCFFQCTYSMFNLSPFVDVLKDTIYY